MLKDPQDESLSGDSSLGGSRVCSIMAMRLSKTDISLMELFIISGRILLYALAALNSKLQLSTLAILTLLGLFNSKEYWDVVSETSESTFVSGSDMNRCCCCWNCKGLWQELLLPPLCCQYQSIS